MAGASVVAGLDMDASEPLDPGWAAVAVVDGSGAGDSDTDGKVTLPGKEDICPHEE